MPIPPPQMQVLRLQQRLPGSDPGLVATSDGVGWQGLVPVGALTGARVSQIQGLSAMSKEHYPAPPEGVPAGRIWAGPLASSPGPRPHRIQLRALPYARVAK